MIRYTLAFVILKCISAIEVGENVLKTADHMEEIQYQP
jgi:hypothetical protein